MARPFFASVKGGELSILPFCFFLYSCHSRCLVGPRFTLAHGSGIFSGDRPSWSLPLCPWRSTAVNGCAMSQSCLMTSSIKLAEGAARMLRSRHPRRFGTEVLGRYSIQRNGPQQESCGSSIRIHSLAGETPRPRGRKTPTLGPLLPYMGDTLQYGRTLHGRTIGGRGYVGGQSGCITN